MNSWITIYENLVLSMWVGVSNGRVGPGQAINRRPVAQLGLGLWARWLVNGPGHAKMLGPRAGGLFELSQNGFQKSQGKGEGGIRTPPLMFKL